MALYLITGIQGSGKSTVLAELIQRGYQAYDVDFAGPATAKWQHNTTGFVHPKSSVKKEARTPEFLANHSWIVPRQEVAELAKQAATKTIFLGGAFTNEPELHDLFNMRFALAIDDDTMMRRLATRTNNDWGVNPHELDLALQASHDWVQKHQGRSYVVIDASQPINMVVAQILSHIHDDN